MARYLDSVSVTAQTSTNIKNILSYSDSVQKLLLKTLFIRSYSILHHLAIQLKKTIVLVHL